MSLPSWAPDEIPRHVYFYSQLVIIVTIYLKLIFFPFNQNIDHDFGRFDSLLDPHVLGSASIIAMLVVLIVLSFRKLKIISFGILWFLITISPTSSIIPNSEFVAEHRVYLPMIGIMMIPVAFFNHIRYKRSIIVIFSMIILTSMILTVKRNTVWGSEVLLWQDSVHKSMNKARPWYALGGAYEKNGDLDRAKKAYEQSVKIFPNYVLALNNLGNIYQYNAELNTAISFYQRATTLSPNYAQGHYNLGLVYIKQKRFKDAMVSTLRALEIKSNYVDAIYNLGMIFENQRQLEKAVSQYLRVTALNPSHSGAYYNLGVIAIQTGNKHDAIRYLHNTINNDPLHLHANIALANLYFEQGDLKSAVGIALRASSIIEGQNDQTHLKTGTLFFKTNLTDLAIEEFKKGLEYNYNNGLIHYYLGMTYRQLNKTSDANTHLTIAADLGIEVGEAGSDQ